ncbi:class E sortase, partial [Streptomyces sp. URMC 129]|uniref:class E sortase n=1 Tax=Streptomyces sp. URMC 129 TaxID=3423407 RepID=UPI003F19D878
PAPPGTGGRAARRRAGQGPGPGGPADPTVAMPSVGTPDGRAARRRAGQTPAAEEVPPTGGRAARRRAGHGGPAAAGGEVPGGRAARRRAGQAAGDGVPGARRAPEEGPVETTAALPSLATAEGGDGGRAARRRAAQGRRTGPGVPEGGRAARRRAGQTPAAEEVPLTGGRAARRKAAKAAAKAARQTGTALSNVIGELFITTGVLLLLFVVYQLWWTNVEAKAHADGQADRLEEQWENDENRDPGAFSPGEGFAILYLPTLDVRVPIAETVDPESVLDNGMVGHYTEEDRLPTAMPWDEEGNFGLAGHRNTHGEPFRYINRLEPGDPIVVETQDTYYTYEMTTRLDQTPPSNTAVLDPVPDQGGFTEPGRYITLTTCTPEFTSTYRMIVWGQMIEERPRSEGKPDALVD